MPDTFGPSSISLAARRLRLLLANELSIHEGQISFGPPAAPNSGPSDSDGEGPVLLNLLFFEIGWDGQPADAVATDPVSVRIRCLITALGPTSTEDPGYGEGEGDLRLLGAVIDILRRHPTIPHLDNEPPNTLPPLRVVPGLLKLEELGQLWGPQQQASFRPSVAYELGPVLVPIQEQTPETSGRVQEADAKVSVGVRASDAWTPEIHFIVSGRPLDAIRLQPANNQTLEMAGWPAVSCKHWAGWRNGPETVELVWEAWVPNTGWTSPADIPADAQTLALGEPPEPVPAAATLHLPFHTGARQLQVHAIRDRQIYAPDGTVVHERLRSQPLLIAFEAAQ